MQHPKGLRGNSRLDERTARIYAPVGWRYRYRRILRLPFSPFPPLFLVYRILFRNAPISFPAYISTRFSRVARIFLECTLRGDNITNAIC